MADIELDATRELLEQLINGEITEEEYLEKVEEILSEMFPEETLE